MPRPRQTASPFSDLQPLASGGLIAKISIECLDKALTFCGTISVVGYTAQIANSCGRDAEAFLNGGFSEEQILGVILAISVKVFSNYTNHLFDTKVDAAFEGRSGPEPGGELAA